MKRVYIFLLMLVLISCKEQANNSTPATSSSQNKTVVYNFTDRYYVQIASLKMRATPDLKGEKVALLEKGDSFLILEVSEHSSEYEGNQSKWGKIKFQGQEGWVYLAYVDTDLPDLLSDKEREKITDNFNKVVEEKEREVAEEKAKDPYYQSCSSASCGVMTAEYANAKRGCTSYKVEEINALGLEYIMGAANKYGDAYCIALFANLVSQCPIQE